MTEVDLGDYDWIVLSTSSGKDSSAMTSHVCELARKENLLHRVVGVHADLSEEEWPGCRELAEEHCRHYGVRFEVVKRPQGGILEHARQRHASLKARGAKSPPWPSPPNRWCTSDHKRGQISTLYTRLAAETRARRPGRRARLLSCMGMRADESSCRAKLAPFKPNEKQSNGRRLVHDWLPIFHWGLADVRARNAASGLRQHEAYALGMPRLSCVFCIFAGRDALLLAGQHRPDLLDKYCEVEEETGFTFQSGLSLIEVRDALRGGERPNLPIRSWEM